MKIIFLDVDGVLNNLECFKKREHLSDDLITKLDIIQKSSKANIVMSSTWRFGLTSDGKIKNPGEHYWLDKLVSTFNELNIPLISRTCRSDSGNRGEEILEWLNSHDDVENYVIIDDDSFDIVCHKELKPHFVKTQTMIGLTDEQASKAIRILNQ